MAHAASGAPAGAHNIVQVAAGDPYRVTPSNPLIITETDVTFAAVIIEGGDISVRTQTRASFITLEKTS
jgi:hypothetical protein